MLAIRKTLVVATVLACALMLAFFVWRPAVARAAPPWSDLPVSLLDTYGLTLDEVSSMSNGYPDGTWRPYTHATRGHFVRLAMAYFQIRPESIGFVYQHFLDVPLVSPYYGWVEAAFEVGLVNGLQAPSKNGLPDFGLYDSVTREQAATILARYLSKMDPSKFDLSTYTDERVQTLLAPFSDGDQVRQKREVALAIDSGILRPSGTALQPKASLTRIQAAALIARAGQLAPPVVTEPPTYPDHTLWLLMNDAFAAGIQMDTAQLGSLAPWMPRTLLLQARVAVASNSVYQTTADKLISLAESYRALTNYSQVRILLVIPGGEVVYDRTFLATTPTS